MNTLLLLVIIPLLIALTGLFSRAARWLPRVAAGLMLVQLPVVIWLVLPVLSQSGSVATNLGIDGIGAAFLVITTLVATAAFCQAAWLLPAERPDEPLITDKRFTMFYTLTGLFIIAMYGVLLAQNLGYMWIAMEATTLISATLIHYHRTRKALEATWKYLLLCSVGIAFALLGTIMIVAAQHTIPGEGTMHLDTLMQRAAQCDPRLLRLGFILCLLGYGTKAGIFPLHNWLPDAHSEAPAPVSAMLSGALLNCALVAIWRLSQLMHAAGQDHLVSQLLVPAGAITVIAAALMLIRQHDLKRMWAYSSVEHVGILLLAIGIRAGPLFILHALNHSLVKVALFLLAGSILHLYGSKSLRKLKGLVVVAPVWGGLLLAGSFAIAGSPPFGTFISEWLILRDTITAHEYLAAGVVVTGLAITTIAVINHVARVVFGKAPTRVLERPHKSWALVPAVLLLFSLVAGLAVTPPVISLLTKLAQVGGIAQ
ncbi:MAG: proton-conducting transporter membrane subunit [bacterium]